MKINLYCNLFNKTGTVLVKCCMSFPKKWRGISEEKKKTFDNVKNLNILYRNFYILKQKKL